MPASRHECLRTVRGLSTQTSKHQSFCMPSHAVNSLAGQARTVGCSPPPHPRLSNKCIVIEIISCYYERETHTCRSTCRAQSHEARCSSCCMDHKMPSAARQLLRHILRLLTNNSHHSTPCLFAIASLACAVVRSLDDRATWTGHTGLCRVG